MSQFHWVRNPDILITQLGLLFQNLSQGCNQSVGQDQGFICRQSREDSTSKITHKLGRIQFLVGYQISISTTCSLLDTDHTQLLSCRPLQYCNMICQSINAKKAKENFPVRQKSHLIIGVISHYLCHVLLVRSKSLCQLHTQERYTWGMSTRRRGLLGTFFEICHTLLCEN